MVIAAAICSGTPSASRRWCWWAGSRNSNGMRSPPAALAPRRHVRGRPSFQSPQTVGLESSSSFAKSPLRHRRFELRSINERSYLLLLLACTEIGNQAVLMQGGNLQSPTNGPELQFGRDAADNGPQNKADSRPP